MGLGGGGGRLETWNKGAGAWGGSLRAWGPGGGQGAGVGGVAGPSGDVRTDVRSFARTDGKFTPLFYRTLSPSGPLPKSI